MRATDAYSFDCAVCKKEAEVPISAASDGHLRCGHCGSTFPFEWPARYPEES